MKQTGQYVVGFAAETNDLLENANRKLASKNADMIIANSLKDEGAGFGVDTNKISIITKKEEELRNVIIHDLHSGATVYEAYGAYNMQKRNEIITIVDKTEYQKLMNYINHEDPQAFITVYNVSDMRYQPNV